MASGKTTTTINLGAALAESGRRVLIVDLDPQGNASTGLAIEDRSKTTYDLLLDATPLAEVVQTTAIDNLSIAPATTDLSSADMEMMSNESRSFLLRNALTEGGVANDYDVVLIDCPPSLSLLTVNAMVAAHSILVPLQSEFFCARRALATSSDSSTNPKCRQSWLAHRRRRADYVRWPQ